MIQEIIKTSDVTPAPDPSPAYQVREVCAVLGVSASGFYAHQHKAQRPRRREDEVLAGAMKSAFEQSRRTYGSPRLVRALRERGLHISKTRARRLMKSYGLCPRQKRRARVRTTCSSPSLPVAPHLLLEAPPAQKPGERFYSDITYIPTQEGWLFTAATIDAYSRKCVGWSAADNMEAPLVLRAAQRAFVNADVDGTIHHIHHSDRGSQYASELFRSFYRNTAWNRA